ISVLIYVIIGGFRAVALTDTIQGIVMFVGTLVLLIAVIVAGGGVNQIISGLYVENPNLITPFGDDGSLSAAYVYVYCCLVFGGLWVCVFFYLLVLWRAAVSTRLLVTYM